MRSITSTILFEEALDLIPSGSSAVFNSVTRLLQPVVQITTADCGTRLGERVAITLDLVGRTELATGLTINRARLNAASTSGLKYLFVRSLSTCIAPGGVCQACWKSTRQYDNPSVSSFQQVTPEFIVQTEHLEALAGTQVFTLSYAPSQYDVIYIYSSAGLIPSSGYTISGTTVTFLVAPATDSGTGAGTAVISLAIKYAVRTYVPFVHWLAGTYSGSLLGMSKLPIQYLPIRQELHESLIPEGEIDSLAASILGSPKTPTSVSNWLPSVTGTLERAIFVSLLNALYLVG